VDGGSIGSRKTAYLNLGDEDFERLLFALAEARRKKSAHYDRAYPALAGGDAGMDVSLWKGERLVGAIQCKRLSTPLALPDALRELLKLLLFLAAEGKLPRADQPFRYYLALAKDPSRTTAEFFKAPQIWVQANQSRILELVSTLIDRTASLQSLRPDEVIPDIVSRMRTIDYRLLRPVKLDEWLDEAPSVHRRFFRPDQVVTPGAAGRAVGRKLKRFFPERSLPRLPTGDRARRAVAKKLARLVADKLDRSAIYKRGKTIRRSALDEAIGAFLASPAKVLPVIGLSGVGKSSALAEIAERETRALPPRLLIRGAEINPTHLGIADLIDRLPWEAAGHSKPDLGRLADFFARGGQPLLILLDGLNEAIVDNPHLRNCWIPNTLDWLQRHHVKLLVTCRPERWSAIATALPPHMLFALPDRSENSSEGSKASELAGLVRLLDFTPFEAAEALEAYGMESWLSARATGHPFLLHLADVLGSRADIRTMDLSSILETFIHNRIAQALDRLGKPRWRAEIRNALAKTAMRMLEESREIVSRRRIEQLFGDYLDAVDALCDEHLLEFVEGGYRFQHDQVREFLQSTQLDLEMVRRGIPTVPDRSHASAMFLLVLRTIWDTLVSRFRRRRRGAMEPPPAIAAFFLQSRLSGSEAPQVGEVLEKLDQAAHDPYGSSAKSYARQCILLLLATCPGDAAEQPLFEGWLKRMLGRTELIRDRWPEELDCAAVSFLARSSLPNETKRFYLSLLLPREDEFYWRGRDLANDAFLETLWRSQGRELTTLNQAFDHSPPAQLIADLLGSDFDDTLAWLATVLDDHRPLARVGPSDRPRIPVSTIAMRVLFRYRDIAPEKIISAAFAASSPDTLRLLEAFAKSHPDELASKCLEHLPDSSPEDTERIQYVLWHVAKSTTASEATLEYAIRVLYSKEARGLYLVWAVRIFLARRARHRHLANVEDFRATFSEIVTDFQPAAERATLLLRAHLHVNQESDHVAEDYCYLLDEDFEAGLAMLDDQIVSLDGLKALAFNAVDKFLTPSRMNEPERRAKYVRIVDLLSRFLDLHGEKAAALMAKSVLTMVEQIGRKQYAFSASDAQEIRLLELGLQVLRVGGPAVWFVSSTLVWPCHWRVRKALFRELRTAPLSDGDVESLVKTLCNNDHVVDPRLAMAYLEWLRVKGRELAWDEAVRRHLYHADPSDCLTGRILTYWRDLPAERRSLISEAVIARLLENCTLREAVDPRGPAGVRWRAGLKRA
jgi:hypothetical protein